MSLGILGSRHTSLIGIPVGRLSGGFIFCYEVCRRNGWSILPMGTNEDAADIAKLISQYKVDVVIMLPNLIDAVFVQKHASELSTVRHVLYLGEMLPEALTRRLASCFPYIRIDPLLYSSNDTGPIGCPVRGEKPNTYKVFDHVALEVSSNGIDFAVSGTGELFSLYSRARRAARSLEDWRLRNNLARGGAVCRVAWTWQSVAKVSNGPSGSSFIVEKEQVLARSLKLPVAR